ncbi:hypothetical protein DEO72_LG11g1773 [Vigna unguiculata]|uniref:Uncharacterized protein n=1 Tax=Vigna unguiculata TaxID=3917 RepID=A0A4D6NSM5_VIGUN|nr:hypothetical protein DEO72_LG11g1773 [Vigna unguiculata]
MMYAAIETIVERSAGVSGAVYLEVVSLSQTSKTPDRALLGHIDCFIFELDTAVLSPSRLLLKAAIAFLSLSSWLTILAHGAVVPGLHSLCYCSILLRLKRFYSSVLLKRRAPALSDASSRSGESDSPKRVVEENLMYCARVLVQARDLHFWRRAVSPRRDGRSAGVSGAVYLEVVSLSQTSKTPDRALLGHIDCFIFELDTAVLSPSRLLLKAAIAFLSLSSWLTILAHGAVVPGLHSLCYCSILLRLKRFYSSVLLKRRAPALSDASSRSGESDSPKRVVEENLMYCARVLVQARDLHFWRRAVSPRRDGSA